VPGVTNAVAISVGYNNACALLGDAEIKCWGDNFFNQLIDDNDTGPHYSQKSVVSSVPTVELLSPPTQVDGLTISARAQTTLELSWNVPNSDSLTIDQYRVEWSNDGATWSSKDVDSTSTAITGLNIASAYKVRVSAHSDAGWGPTSETVDAFTTGTRTLRFKFTTSDGTPLTGGQVSWQGSNSSGSYQSASSYGVTANGILQFPRVVAGNGTITATDLTLKNGLKVSGTWPLLIGSAQAILTVPEAPTEEVYAIQVSLPNGKPVSDAAIKVTGLEKAVNVQGFIFTSVSDPTITVSTGSSWTILGGTTNVNGQFRIKGFHICSLCPSGDIPGNPIAMVTYNDGLLVQTKQADMALANTHVVFDEMPWFTVGTETATANFNSLVSIPVTVHETAQSALINKARLAIGITIPLATISITPPVGANQKCKGAILNAKSNKSGKVTLKVCATKSGVYKFKGKGAVATGALTLKVKGAPPMPVTSANGITPSLGSARLAWNTPIYLGGATVKNYKVTLRSGGKTFTKTVTTKSATFTGLKNATTYTATIVAVTKFGNSDPVTFKVAVA